MPPKSPSRSRSKSPPTKPAAASVGKKSAAAPAGSASVAKAAAPAPTPKKSLSKAAAPAVATTTATTTLPATSSSSGMNPVASALVIQRVGRGLQARATLGATHKGYLKAKLAELRDQRGDAFAAFQRKQAAADKKSESTAKERYEARLKLQADLSLAAFDGDTALLRKLLARGANPLKPDPDGNYALGEAAVNGQADAASMLIDAGADPNAKGTYGRTPLWRAAFNSHAGAIKVLLEGGADPRIAAQGQLPAELPTGDAKQLLQSWNTSKTDAIVAAFSKRRADAEAKEAKLRAAERATHESAVAAARDKFHKAQLTARHARGELEHRIFEFDFCGMEGKGDKAKETLLQVIKDHEAAAEAADNALALANDEYLAARRDANAALAEGPSDGNETDSSVMTVTRAEVGQLVTPGWAAKAAAAGSAGAAAGAVYPFLIDVSATSNTFFRYRNVNFIDAFSPNDLAPSRVRKALLGALRYGKGFVIDLRDVPMLDFVVEAFEAVRKGLWEIVVSGAVTEESQYLSLVVPEDGKEYEKDQWRSPVTKQFVLLLLTSGFFVDEDVAKRFLVFRVDFDE